MEHSTMLSNMKVLLLTLACGVCMSVGAAAIAEPPEGDGGESDAAAEAGDAAADAGAETEEADDPEEEKHDYLAITGAIVHTITEGTHEGVVVLCKDGVIEEIGRFVEIPEGARVIDASGLHLYPGLVAIDSRGVLGNGAAADTTDFFSITFVLAKAAGITTARSGEEVAKLTDLDLEGMVIGSNLFERLRADRPAQQQELRRGFEEAKQFQRDMERYRRNKDRDPDLTEPDQRKLGRPAQQALKLMRGEAKAIVQANEAGELLFFADLAERYGFELVIEGGQEAWTIPAEIARSGASVIVTPRARVPHDERFNRRTGSSIENAAILHRHGVKLAVLPVGSWFGPGNRISLGGLGGRDLLNLPLEAAFAVRGGLPEDAAIRTITIDAAEILGVADRVGSIEVGKDADFAIMDGPLLDYLTMTRYTIVNGKVVYDKMAEGLFDHVRPDGEVRVPVVPEIWPRRLGAPW